MMDVALMQRSGAGTEAYWRRLRGPHPDPLPKGEGEEGVLRHELVAEVPGLDEAWTIGAIVGPSGSGKTTLARAAFGEAAF